MVEYAEIKIKEEHLDRPERVEAIQDRLRTWRECNQHKLCDDSYRMLGIIMQEMNTLK
jgi:hypothetical protein